MTSLTEHIEMTERKEGAGWYTAMFFFLEHMRLLSKGTINHKILFARLSEKGNLINHSNPRIRRSVAASLSRTVHSARYAEALRASCEEDSGLIEEVVDWLYAQLVPLYPNTAELVVEMGNVVWADVLVGLGNERFGGRAVDVMRASNEMQLVKSWAELACLDDRARFSLIVSAMLRIMTYGHLDAAKAHQFAGETLLDEVIPARCSAESAIACLIRVSCKTDRVSGVWALEPSKTYAVGRYSDCDIFDPDPHVSRRQCVLLCKDNIWYAKNESRSRGLRVLDGDGEVLASVAPSDSEQLVKILPEQVLELSGASQYLFLGMDSLGFDMVGCRE